MIKRDAETSLLNSARQFKSVVVIGPRQSGKTTLVKAIFSQKAYVGLENPDYRKFAADDYNGFLSNHSDSTMKTCIEG